MSLVSSGDRGAYFLGFICIILIVRQTIALPVCWILVETIAQTPEDGLPRESVLWGPRALGHFISVPSLFCSFTASPNLVHKSQEQMITSLNSESSSTHHLPFLQNVTLKPSSRHFLWNIWTVVCLRQEDPKYGRRCCIYTNHGSVSGTGMSAAGFLLQCLYTWPGRVNAVLFRTDQLFTSLKQKTKIMHTVECWGRVPIPKSLNILLLFFSSEM